MTTETAVNEDQEQPEFDFPFGHEPDDDSVVVERLPNGNWHAAWLCRDEDCESPLESNDCEGKIYDRRRNRHGNAEFWEHVSQEYVAGRTEWTFGRHTAWVKPNCLLLDVYDHGGESWRITNSGQFFPDERWDVSPAAAVWVPDKGVLENVWCQVLHALMPAVKVDYYSHESTSGAVRRRIVLELPSGAKPRYFDSHTNAAKAGLEAYRKSHPAEFQRVWQECLHKYCKGVIDNYNNWLSGDCWGVVDAEFDADGRIVGDFDSCWGYIGSKYAKEERDSRLESKEKRVAKEQNS